MIEINPRSNCAFSRMIPRFARYLIKSLVCDRKARDLSKHQSVAKTLFCQFTGRQRNILMGIKLSAKKCQALKRRKNFISDSAHVRKFSNYLFWITRYTTLLSNIKRLSNFFFFHWESSSNSSAINFFFRSVNRAKKRFASTASENINNRHCESGSINNENTCAVLSLNRRDSCLGLTRHGRLFSHRGCSHFCLCSQSVRDHWNIGEWNSFHFAGFLHTTSNCCCSRCEQS